MRYNIEIKLTLHIDATDEIQAGMKAMKLIYKKLGIKTCIVRPVRSELAERFS
ncbi:MAG: hypothetical protein WAM14_08180 [Candidatus Nitrosopolaris sp.]